MRFTKMQGLGNDYLYFWGEPEDPAEVSRKLSDRHFGAGSDGIIVIGPSDRADFKMRIFNADGSEAGMCGNGIRCVGKYVYDKGLTDKTRLTVETLAGIRTLDLHLCGGRVKSVSVDMGPAEAGEDLTLTAGNQTLVCTPVDVGNPHAVIFVHGAEEVPLTALGPRIERSPAFPGGVNVDFVEVLSGDRLRMRVWERGSGVTLACGTGACASVAAAVKKGYCRIGEEIAVVLDGGTLKIRIASDGGVTMTGPAEFVYEGETELC